jgi:hypothetical protein
MDWTLLAQKTTGVQGIDWSRVLSEPGALVFCIPIVAIIVGGIVTLVKVVIAHRERMAMIEQGIHPDHPPEEVVPEQDTPSRPEGLQQTQPYQRR